MTHATVDPRNRLVINLGPPAKDSEILSNMVVTAGDLRVTLSVGHDPDGDYLRIVTDAPYSGVQLRSESLPLHPEAVPA